MRATIGSCRTSRTANPPAGACPVPRHSLSRPAQLRTPVRLAAAATSVISDYTATTSEVRTSVLDTGRNLVVAVDHTAEAWNAVKWTLENMYRAGDVLHLMHVVPQGFSSGPKPLWHLHSPPVDEDVQERVAEEAHSFILQNYVVLAAKYNAACEINLVKGGCREAIGAAICKKSAALSAAAVVLPGEPNNLLLEMFKGGSVARHVAHYCTRPTIILH